MNFLADENVDAQMVEALRADSHSVLYIAEMQPGLDDDQILDLANSTGSILLTEDKDFGALIYRLGKATSGVLLVRLPGLSAGTKIELVGKAILEHSSNLRGAFTVISPGFMRIRRN